MIKGAIVTGGSGFIGDHLLKKLLDIDRYQTILVLDKRPCTQSHEKIVFHHCNIEQRIRVSLDAHCEYDLYHLGALCKEPGYDWEEYFETNYVGTKNVSEFATKNNIRNIVFTSTMMVFKAGEHRNTEEDLKAPDTAYGISKLLAEEVLLNWNNSNSENRLRIIRPGVVFGKGENGNYLRLYKALRKNVFCYVGRRTTIKSSVYVKDLVNFISQSLKGDFPNQTYNFVLPQPITIEEIVYTFCKLFGWRRFIPTIPYWLLMIVSYLCEVLDYIGLRNDIHHRRVQKLYYSTNLSSELVIKDGFQFSYDLEAALKDWKNECGGIELC